MSEHLVSDGYKLGDRDAMAWQVFLALSCGDDLFETYATLSYELPRNCEV